MSLISSDLLTLMDHKKFKAALLCLIGIFVIGDIDYLTGYQVSMLVFYILTVGFATIYVGPIFALFLAVLSIVISISTDFWSGMPYSETTVLVLNASVVLTTFVIVVGLLHGLNRIMLMLQSSVEQRTQALLSEMTERGRLEREIIDLSEQEQQRFGQELHDVVCQELASVAIAARMLERKLSAAEHDETAHARELAQMADHALEKARSVARGFFTAGFDSAGLAEALTETARNTEEKHRISCVVQWQKNLSISNEETVIHLFRIAQEAIQNAVKHAMPSHIKVRLETKEKKLKLVIEDDGKGLPTSNAKGKGLGLNIMAHRAGLIGGVFKMEQPASGGTRVICEIPMEKLRRLSLAPLHS